MIFTQVNKVTFNSNFELPEKSTLTKLDFRQSEKNFKNELV